MEFRLVTDMVKHVHEIRDPVHVFIRLDTDERRVLASRPFQRLRHIHQLALSYLIYPGATHTRFEHSLGVMELADRVFRVITQPENRDHRVDDVYLSDDALAYWRRVLRMAALCHDIGHLPFSHGPEELLPDGKSHEDITVDLIQSAEMREIWESVTPPLRANDIAKLAVGPQKLRDQKFSNWETILAEIIVGDAFGVDRMDYLLRDSLHAGVAYGKFDHFRLIDTLRILPKSNDSPEPVLGIESGGLESAESLLLARYFMYSQVYFHRVRRVYNLHLQDFLRAWLGVGGLPCTGDAFLSFFDDVVLVEMHKAARDESHPGHDAARRIVRREHSRVLYERNPSDLAKNPEAPARIHTAVQGQFSQHRFLLDSKRLRGGGTVFPVRARDGRIVSSLDASQVLQNLPAIATDYVYAPIEVFDKAQKWLVEHREAILTRKEGAEQ